MIKNPCTKCKMRPFCEAYGGYCRKKTIWNWIRKTLRRNST